MGRPNQLCLIFVGAGHALRDVMTNSCFFVYVLEPALCAFLGTTYFAFIRQNSNFAVTTFFDKTPGSAQKSGDNPIRQGGLNPLGSPVSPPYWTLPELRKWGGSSAS